MEALLSFWLVLARLGGAIAATPLFASAPVWGKTALTLALTLLVLPGVPTAAVAAVADGSGTLFWGTLVSEALVGILLGFTLRLLVAGVQLAGGVVDLQMGLAIATTVDPQEHVSSTMVSSLWHSVVLLLIITTDLHRLVLEGIAHSYELIPIGHWQTGGLLAVVQLGAGIFSTGLMLSLPITGILLIADLVLGVMMKSAPQINIFSVGIPLKVLLTLALLVLTLPYVVSLISALGDQVVLDLERVLRLTAAPL